MQKARYWLLLKIATTPKAFAWGAGILIVFMLMAAVMTTLVWLDQGRVVRRHHAAMHIFEKLDTESAGLLAHLLEHDANDCSTEALIHLNTHLLQSRYIREIGLLDDQRRLVCTTSLGMLPKPIKGNYPVLVSRSGMQLLNNVPLTMADKQFSSAIVQRPPFNVVLSRYAMNDIYASADMAWLSTTDGLAPLSQAVGSPGLAAMRARASRQEYIGFTLHGLGYEVITAPPQQDLVLQTQRRLATIIGQSSLLLAMLFAGSLLIAGLVVGAAAPYVLRFCGLRNRIGFLCDETHLRLVYQPIFDLATMRPVGCEVLARLDENTRFWMPDELVPAIRGAGLESRFDYAVTQKAIRSLAAALPACDGKFMIALNYFPKSVHADQLAPVLTQALKAAGRRDLSVCLEITEHDLSSELFAEVQKLKAQGFLIAIDDFGTGYSNLKSVTTLSPDVLKIDRSFVYELEDAALRSNLIPEMVNIARAINARTVAEGIEKPQQAYLLAAAGVHYGQGFALARPMELEALIAFLENYK